MISPGSRHDPAIGPKIVAFGGGTGMSCLLLGLKEYSHQITAVVTVTDDGGSSGRLRKELDMVPPGDIRACLLALSDGEPLLSRLLQYRFEESELAGHNFGNLFIAAMTRVTGSFDRAIRELNDLLRVRGRVLPATGQKVSLIAHHPDGSKSTGEVRISNSTAPIERVEMRPRVGSVAEDITTAIAEAEFMVFGPGSLFTSVIPNLLVSGIREGVLANPCPKVYVGNIMTQPGETNGMGLEEHLDALESHAEEQFITGVLIHRGEIPAEYLQRYAALDAHPVSADEALIHRRGLRLAEGDVVDLGGDTLRHDPERLAELINRTFLADLGVRPRA